MTGCIYMLLFGRVVGGYVLSPFPLFELLKHSLNSSRYAFIYIAIWLEHQGNRLNGFMWLWSKKLDCVKQIDGNNCPLRWWPPKASAQCLLNKVYFSAQLNNRAGP